MNTAVAETDAALLSSKMPNPLVQGFSRLDLTRKMLLISGALALFGVLFMAFFMANQPDYRVLYANLADKDGGAVLAQLSQMLVVARTTQQPISIQQLNTMTEPANTRFQVVQIPWLATMMQEPIWMTAHVSWLRATARFVMATEAFWYKMPMVMAFAMQTKSQDALRKPLVTSMQRQPMTTALVSRLMVIVKFVMAMAVSQFKMPMVMAFVMAMRLSAVRT